MYEWRTGRSCVFKNTVHLVFVTKYRRGVFSTEMLARTKEVMQETCLQMDCELYQSYLQISPDMLTLQRHSLNTRS